MNIIIAVIVALVVGAVFWGVWVLLGRVFSGIPHAIAGIVLLLVWLAIVLAYFHNGPFRIGARKSGQGLVCYQMQQCYKPMKPGDMVVLLHRKSSI